MPHIFKKFNSYTVYRSIKGFILSLDLRDRFECGFENVFHEDWGKRIIR